MPLSCTKLDRIQLLRRSTDTITPPDRTGLIFLIDKDGVIYQTVPVNKKCWHVGKLKSRCMMELTCDAVTKNKYDAYKKDRGWNYQMNQMYRDESKLPYPQRYPANDDSIGIEIVSRTDHSGDAVVNGKTVHHDKFVVVTAEEQRSLDWLLPNLLQSLHLTRKDIYRHAEVSYKLEDEGASAHY